MKRQVSALMLILCMVFSGTISQAAERVLFGPVQYDVKERYGKPNQYTAPFSAEEGKALIKLQSGNNMDERSDWIEFKLNGATILPDSKYGYRFLAGFLPVKKDNTFDLLIKDDKPSGMRRPVLPHRFVIVSASPVPAAMNMMDGVFGFNDWAALKTFAEVCRKIASTESFSLAVTAADLSRPVAQRAEAMRKLSTLKDRTAEDYLIYMYSDTYCASDVRAEAAFALVAYNDKKFVSLLLPGVLEPDEHISIPTARALSLLPEAFVEDGLLKMLERLDNMRKDEVIHTIVTSGWKPVATLLKMAESKDPQVTTTAIRLLGAMQDQRVTDPLLKMLAAPGKNNPALIIVALGQNKDPRAVDALLAIANDRDKRQGNEIELGDALANLNDQRAVAPITDMIKKANNRYVMERLMVAYKKLTGKDY